MVFLLGFVVAGLDVRFGWSDAPAWVAIASDAAILASYYIVFLTFKENPFAARTVEVFEGQKVIDTGLYAVVRHPMYAGAIPMYFFIPLALGSYWALLTFVPVLAIIILRLLDEEEVLKRDLPGYKEYCQKYATGFCPGCGSPFTFCRLEVLRELEILVSVRFDYQTNGISRYRTFCVYSV